MAGLYEVPEVTDYLVERGIIFKKSNKDTKITKKTTDSSFSHLYSSWLCVKINNFNNLGTVDIPKPTRPRHSGGQVRNNNYDTA